MTKELNLFKGLFQPFENISILTVNPPDFLNSTISNIVKELNGTLKSIEKLDEKASSLNRYTREFEYIILGNVFQNLQNPHTILKIVYKALENSADLIILEKKESENLDKLKTLLDENSFVAINSIELFKEYDLITAKKLHMWGSGL